MKVELAKNVLEFIENASGIVGRYEADIFNQNSFSQCYDGTGMDSPIEQIIYVAIQALAQINFIKEANDPVQENGEWHVAGLSIIPQAKIGNYRIDFSISHGNARTF
jgi:hypothetical protein